MADLKYKSIKVLRNLIQPAWHQTLTALFLEMYMMLDVMYFTSGYREGDPGCHGTIPLRAYDLRSRVYKDPQSIVDRVNSRWIYDPDRAQKTVAMLHDVGRGIHMHFQVHDKTHYKGV